MLLITIPYYYTLTNFRSQFPRRYRHRELHCVDAVTAALEKLNNSVTVHPTDYCLTFLFRLIALHTPLSPLFLQFLLPDSPNTLHVFPSQERCDIR
jgi:hypothetical protein